MDMTSREELKAAQITSWNNAPSAWRKWWAVFEGGAQTLSDRMVDLAEIKPGHRVLDMATGIGEPAITAADRVKPGGTVTANDISRGMLVITGERARER